jgi:muconolactone delta-isomerase
MASKFLVLWRLELSRLSPETIQTVLRQQDYGARLQAEGKVQARYHLVGSHGGAWIYNVESNEELDSCLRRPRFTTSPAIKSIRWPRCAVRRRSAPRSQTSGRGPALPDTLALAFVLAARGTACEGARLEQELAACRLRCPSCAVESTTSEPDFRCRTCGLPAVLLSGNDLVADPR